MLGEVVLKNVLPMLDVGASEMRFAARGVLSYAYDCGRLRLCLVVS